MDNKLKFEFEIKFIFLAKPVLLFKNKDRNTKSTAYFSKKKMQNKFINLTKKFLDIFRKKWSKKKANFKKKDILFDKKGLFNIFINLSKQKNYK